MREALFTFVGKSKTDVPSVRSEVRKFGSAKVRKCGSADFCDFYQKNMRGGHMSLNSEVLKVETQIFEVLKKKCQSYDLKGKRAIF